MWGKQTPEKATNFEKELTKDVACQIVCDENDRLHLGLLYLGIRKYGDTGNWLKLTARSKPSFPLKLIK
jgi:hypothetical protein